MRKLIYAVGRLFWRFRYPVSLPEEVSKALGIQASNNLRFDEFIALLTSPSCHPTSLSRFMPREEAEVLFKTALKKETFVRESLFSYYFDGAWLEFILHFDSQLLLRRLYVHHQLIHQEGGVEIHLSRHEPTHITPN